VADHEEHRPEAEGGEEHVGADQEGHRGFGAQTVKTFMDPGDMVSYATRSRSKDITFVTLLKFLSSKTPSGVYI
jgi:hypothetical protein